MTVKHITKGVTPHKYEPQKAISRAEIATLIHRILGLESEEYKGIFKDVSKDKWYYHSVEAVAETGIMGEIGNRYLSNKIQIPFYLFSST